MIFNPNLSRALSSSVAKMPSRSWVMVGAVLKVAGSHVYRRHL